MTWASWSLYVVTATVLAIVPGPAVFLVIAQSLQGGSHRGVWAGFGILAVNALFFVMSAVGLTAMLNASYELFTAVKWLGAGYLIYLGLRTFFGKGSLALAASNGAGANPDRTPGWRRRAFMRGVVLQLSNPKAILFFTALVPQFIRTDQPIVGQTVILGVSSILPELVVLGLYATLAGKLFVLARQARFVKTTNRISGALLASAGAGLAFVGEK